MADTKTSGESAAATLDGTELVRGVQSAANVKITIAQIKTYISGALGVASGTSLALGGATIGSYALALTGSAAVSGNIDISTNIQMLNEATNRGIYFGSGFDVCIGRNGAAASFKFGATASATPVAYTVAVGESSIPGTNSDVGGANGTITSGLGTGIGPLSQLSLQSAKASVSGSGSTTQTYVTGLKILSGTAVLTSYTVANLPAAATAGAGATAFVTDASTTLVLGLGGAVTGGGANKVPVYSDATNWNYG